MMNVCWNNRRKESVYKERFKTDHYKSNFIYTFFSLVISSNIHRSLNGIFHDLKVLMKLIKTETFNIDFPHKFIKFGLFFPTFFIVSDLVSIFTSMYIIHTYIHTYIYIYTYIKLFIFITKWYEYKNMYTHVYEYTHKHSLFHFHAELVREV